jgi:hypothetical protein
MQATTQPVISDAQIAQYERDGVVIFDSPFSPDEIAKMSSHIGGLIDNGEIPQQSSADYVTDPVILGIVQHPFLEAVAKSVLRAPEVEFAALAARQNTPQPGAEFRLIDEHVDVGYAPQDWETTPRRMLASILVWLTDVTMETGPMMVRPGSHRMLADYLGAAPAGSERYLQAKNLPQLPYAEPQPILVKAGQISVTTTATIHSASINTGPTPRRVLFTIFRPKGVEIAFNMDDAEKRLAHYETIRPLFRPERRHLVPEPTL